MNKPMKIAMISTSDLQGGAAIAAFRLAEALATTEDIEVHFIVKEKLSDKDFVLAANQSSLAKYRGRLNFALEKASFLPYEASKAIRFFYSNPNFGQDLSTLPAVKNADIIHLHWINKGFLSFRSLEKLFALGKPIVWTLHDMWAFTGGCHYVEHCDHFQLNCGNCFFLRNPKPDDLSHQIWQKKDALYQSTNMTIVTSSNWLQKEAQASSLLRNKKILSIPSTLDTSVFKVMPTKPKKERVILFQAMNINDKRKGLKYFLEALKVLKAKQPAFAEKVRLLVFGKNTSDTLDGLDYPVDYLGFISDQRKIAEAYNQCDIFVIPSLGDNLPNAVIEAMACGKPVVTFDTGGLPEMVDHQKNGYVAPQKDTQALADGIRWTLEDSERYQQLSANALQKVKDCYTYDVVIHQYRELYNSLIPS